MKTLALINSVDDITEILQKSIEFAKDDILEVLFVHEEELFELPDLFRPEYIEDENIDKEAIKQKIKNTLKELKYSRDTAIFVYINDTKSRVEATQKDVSPFIVTKYNDATKDLIDSQYQILFLKENSKSYKNIVINVDLSDEDAKLIDFVKTNFQDAKIELVYDYIHIIADDLMTVEPLIATGSDPYLDEELKEAHQNRFNTLLKEYNLNGEFLDDIANQEELIDYINKSRFDLAILASDNREVASDINKDTIIFN